MEFQSIIFIFTLLVFLIIFSTLQSQNKRLKLLIVFSFISYGWYENWWVLLLLLSSMIDYFSSKYYSRSESDGVIYFGILINISLFLFFKYKSSTSNLIMPLGLSFYTFQSISYLVDSKKKKLSSNLTFIEYLAYLSFFPQLQSGPIIRFKNSFTWIKNTGSLKSKNIYQALEHFSRGLFLKVVVADNLAPIVNQVFNGFYFPNNPWLLLCASYLFLIQVYCDFSGYSQMAVGLGKAFGFTLPHNFNFPYVSRSLNDFWRRWHITLTMWFRDYVFYPLIDFFNIRSKVYIAIVSIIPFILSGLWHGLESNYLIWGLTHGIWLIIEYLTNWPRKLSRYFFGKNLSWLITFGFILFSMFIFRANNFNQIKAGFLSIKNINDFMLLDLNITQLTIALMFPITHYLLYRFKGRAQHIPLPVRSIIITFFIVASVIFRGEHQGFIYFNF